MITARTAGIALALALLLLPRQAGAQAEKQACSLTPGKDWLTCHESCPERPIADALACIRSCLERLAQCRVELRSFGVDPGPVDEAAKAAFIDYHAKAQQCDDEQERKEQCAVKACGERPSFLATEESLASRSSKEKIERAMAQEKRRTVWYGCVDKTKCADKVSLVCRELYGR